MCDWILELKKCRENQWQYFDSSNMIQKIQRKILAGNNRSSLKRSVLRSECAVARYVDACEVSWHRFAVGESATTLKVKVKDEDGVEEVRADWRTDIRIPRSCLKQHWFVGISWHFRRKDKLLRTHEIRTRYRERFRRPQTPVGRNNGQISKVT